MKTWAKRIRPQVKRPPRKIYKKSMRAFHHAPGHTRPTPLGLSNAKNLIVPKMHFV